MAAGQRRYETQINIHQSKRMKTSLLVTFGLLVSNLTAPAQFNSGSTGTNELNITADTTLELPPNGILNFSTITIASNVTLRFNRNSNNTPVYLLATGIVSIFGNIDLSGSNAPTGLLREGGKCGPGGFDGGSPGFDLIPPGDGYGPGGGRGGTGFQDCGGGAASAGSGVYSVFPHSWYNSQNRGTPFGSALLVPLVGGCGGGGTTGAPGVPGIGGGGGGGAILIASSTEIYVSGSIRVDGGDGATHPGIGTDNRCVGTHHINPGSGGAIRLVAPVVGGTGNLSATGPTAGYPVHNYGRIRIDSIDRRNLSQLNSIPTTRSVGNYMVVFPSNRLDLINVAGTAIDEGSLPVTIQLPNGSPTNQTVTVQARNFNGSVPIQIAVTPQNGPRVIYSTNINNSAANPATVTVNIIVPVSTPVTVRAWTQVPPP